MGLGWAEQRKGYPTSKLIREEESNRGQGGGGEGSDFQ